jgi:hypothetical protein
MSVRTLIRESLSRNQIQAEYLPQAFLPAFAGDYSASVT